MTKTFRILLVLIGIADFLFGLGGLIFAFRVNLSDYHFVGIILVVVFFLSFILIGITNLLMGFRWRGVVHRMTISMVANLIFPILTYMVGVAISSAEGFGALIGLMIYGALPLAAYVLWIVTSSITYRNYRRVSIT